MSRGWQAHLRSPYLRVVTTIQSEGAAGLFKLKTLARWSLPIADDLPHHGAAAVYGAIGTAVADAASPFLVPDRVAVACLCQVVFGLLIMGVLAFPGPRVGAPAAFDERRVALRERGTE